MKSFPNHSLKLLLNFMLSNFIPLLHLILILFQKNLIFLKNFILALVLMYYLSSLNRIDPQFLVSNSIILNSLKFICSFFCRVRIYLEEEYQIKKNTNFYHLLFVAIRYFGFVVLHWNYYLYLNLHHLY